MQNLTVKKWNLSIILRISLVALLCGSWTPDYNFNLIKTIPIKGASLSTDKLGNAFVVNTKNEIIKITPDGKVLYTYSNFQLGEVSFVGANNPFKIIVYYPSFATIVTLDNTLSQTGRINLYNLGSNQVSAACVALDNNYWIYDDITFKLIRFDDKFNILQESEDLNALLGQTIKASFIVEKDNSLYLNDPEVGILVFDTYGTYHKTIPLKGLVDFQKIANKLIFFKEKKLYSYNLQTFKIAKIPIPEFEGVIDIHIEKNRLYLLSKNNLALYAY